MAARVLVEAVPGPAAALAALLPEAAPELRMVFPDRRTLPLLVDVPADVLSLLLAVPDVPLMPWPFCLALPLLLPVPFMEGIPRSSKAAATSAALGLPPIRLPEPLPLDCFLTPPPPAAPPPPAPLLVAEETPSAELTLGDVGIPVPAMRFLRAARAASAAVVAVPPPPLPTLSGDEAGGGCCCC